MATIRRALLAACFIVCLLYGCVADDGISGTGITGAGQKGPFVVGAPVTFVLLDTSGRAAGDVPIEVKTTNHLGLFNVKPPIQGHYHGSIKGKQFNEVTGAISEGPLSLDAVIPVFEEDNPRRFINILTDLSYDRIIALAGQGAALDDALTQAESELFTALAGLFGQTGVAEFSAMSLYNFDGTDENANAFLLAVSATFTQVAINKADAEGGAVHAHLDGLLGLTAGDLADNGMIDDQSLWDALRQARSQLNARSLRDNLARRSVEAIGHVVEVPDITDLINDPQQANP